MKENPDILSDIMTDTRKPRDKRTHDERLADLRSNFEQLKAQAIASGKINDCSITKICHKASVSTSYMAGNKLKNDGLNKRYKQIAEDINEFRSNFEKLQADSELTLLIKEKHALEDQRNQAQMDYLEALRSIQGLKQLLEDKNKQLKSHQQLAANIAYQNLQTEPLRKEPSQFARFSTAQVISPDKYLYKNGKYTFHDERMRETAWISAKNELETLLKRPLSTRVYICVGMPCSGKTTWTKGSYYYPDRHPVVIDATNLTKSDRSRWFNLVYKYKYQADIKMCAVYFEVPYAVLQERNNQRTPDRRIPDNKLQDMQHRLEPADISEGFDEIMAIRYE